MPSPSTPAQRCATQVRRSVLQLWRRLRPGLQQDDVSLSKLSVLGLLHRHGPLSPSAIAAHEGVKLQTLTRLLAELESDGVVQRTQSEADRRSSVVSLATAGRRRLAGIMQSSDEALARVIAQTLSPQERALLEQACMLLDRVADAMSSRPAE